MTTKLSTLIAALSSVDAGSRADAAERLAQLGPEAQPAALALTLAVGDEDDAVRQWATEALEGVGPPAVDDVPHLAGLLEAKSPDVGYWAATLLGRLQSDAAPAVDALAKIVAGDADPVVRQRAAWALGEIGASAAAALPALESVSTASDPRLARLAQEAIQRIKPA